MWELMEVARARGYARISLGVENGNVRARHLYLSLGFVDVRSEADALLFVVGAEEAA